VRLGPVTGNVHGHVELRRREEGVDAVELAVEIKLDAWMDVKGCMFRIMFRIFTMMKRV
jgi:hypothetical protein